MILLTFWDVTAYIALIALFGGLIIFITYWFNKRNRNITTNHLYGLKEETKEEINVQEIEEAVQELKENKVVETNINGEEVVENMETVDTNTNMTNSDVLEAEVQDNQIINDEVVVSENEVATASEAAQVSGEVESVPEVVQAPSENEPEAAEVTVEIAEDGKVAVNVVGDAKVAVKVAAESEIETKPVEEETQEK